MSAIASANTPVSEQAVAPVVSANEPTSAGTFVLLHLSFIKICNVDMQIACLQKKSSPSQKLNKVE